MESEFKEWRGRYFTTVPGLRRLREREGFSQRHLAALIGATEHQVARVEGGSRTSGETFLKLAAALRVESLEELLMAKAPGEIDSRRSSDHGQMVAWNT